MSERELTSAPGMGWLFARAALSMIPGASALPVLGARRSAEVGDEVLVLPEAEVDRARLAAYDRVCAFRLRDALPSTFLHVLAFPLHLSLITDPSFPLPAVGLVHVYNRITQHRALGAAERFSLRVWAGPIQPHPRGRQVSLRTEARVGDELVWEEVSTNLRRGGGDEASAAPEVPSSEGLPTVATWRLPGDLGRRYASVSGDYNPIHIHPLSARLFGFPAAIAHGMWTKARSLAVLESRLPAAYTVEVAFKRPVVLPATVNFVERVQAGDTIRFGVRGPGKDTPHLEGVVRPT
jgi:acyl dehydratase